MVALARFVVVTQDTFDSCPVIVFLRLDDLGFIVGVHRRPSAAK
jgi:hypothetical protein